LPTRNCHLNRKLLLTVSHHQRISILRTVASSLQTRIKTLCSCGVLRVPRRRVKGVPGVTAPKIREENEQDTKESVRACRTVGEASSSLKVAVERAGLVSCELEAKTRCSLFIYPTSLPSPSRLDRQTTASWNPAYLPLLDRPFLWTTTGNICMADSILARRRVFSWSSL
jgi:hypothetical protein